MIVALTLLFVVHELAVLAVSRRADKLASQASSLAAARDKSTLAALKSALASPSAGEASSLAAGAEAVASLFPSAACVVAGALSDTGSPTPGSVAVAWSAPWKPSSVRASQHAPPPHELFSPSSSASAAVAAAATAGESDEVLDSASQRGGLHAFPDWQPLADWAAPCHNNHGAPAPPRRVVTIALSAGGRTTGFFVIVFAQREGGGGGGTSSHTTASSAFSNGERPPAPASLPTPPLLEACMLLGASLALLRLESVIRDGLDRALEATGVARQPLSPSRETSRSSSAAGGSMSARWIDIRARGGSEALPPASSDERAASSIAPWDRPGFGGAEAELQSLDESADTDARTLRRWDIDAAALPSAELHRLLCAMFLSSGLLLRFDVKLASFESFTAEIEASYRENAFHHWRHAWNVCHAAWLLVESGGMRQVELVDEVGFYALLLSALAHDIDHPGALEGSAASQSLWRLASLMTPFFLRFSRQHQQP